MSLRKFSIKLSLNKPRNKPRKFEDLICMDFHKELTLRVATDKRLKGLVWYHIPNGGKRNAIIAKFLKLMGVLKGVSDYFIMRASNGYHGLYIEFKAEAEGYKGKLSQAQKDFLANAEREGYKTAVVWSCKEAIDEVYKYLVM